MPFANISGHTFMRQLLDDDSVVLDLGAHRGDFSHRILAQYRCRCVAVEANPTICAEIPENGRLTVLNKVVAGVGEGLTFYLYNRLESSSLIPRDDRGPATEINVPATTLFELLTSLGTAKIGLVKLDIEGAEIAAFDSCPDELLARVPQMTVEFHDFNGVVSRADVLRVVERMRRLGFHVVKMWMRSHGDTLFINNRAMSRSSADLLWSRYVVRNWWWGYRFVRRLRGNRDWPPESWQPAHQ